MTWRLYLDTCAIQRQFDDLRSARERAQAECVEILLAATVRGTVLLVWSEVLDVELAQAPYARRQFAEQVRVLAAEHLTLSPAAISRAKRLATRGGLRHFDSLHLAIAEAGKADLVTTDERFLRRARRRARSSVQVLDPIEAAARMSAP
jgi:predicted nucleic acid-binding protein